MREFLELESPLVGQKCDQELKNIETEYPGLFDADSNALEIEFIEDDIELVLEEEKHIDDLIRINENLQNDLFKELSNETSKEIKTSLKLRSTQDLCNTLGEQLDELNEKLHTQLVKYGSNLYDFEFVDYHFRILHSHQNYLVTRIEVEKLKQILIYLNTTNPDSILSITESVYLHMSRESKEETKRRMCGMLDNISAKLADHHIAQTKLKYAQQELELHQ
ncbi:hypothetical protein NQ314_012690 [Rhamnusium bicolor]|uniref:Uncharacterized protein n=1 Tax=Rhamnusium bicolor TaxID=1586634 RepID=A0AAV8XB59_9CUCU|nr:hypothetical protein NQ314_012690 [Rhamnusium bicolor]